MVQTFFLILLISFDALGADPEYGFQRESFERVYIEPLVADARKIDAADRQQLASLEQRINQGDSIARTEYDQVAARIAMKKDDCLIDQMRHFVKKRFTMNCGIEGISWACLERPSDMESMSYGTVAKGTKNINSPGQLIKRDEKFQEALARGIMLGKGEKVPKCKAMSCIVSTAVSLNDYLQELVKRNKKCESALRNAARPKCLDTFDEILGHFNEPQFGGRSGREIVLSQCTEQGIRTLSHVFGLYMEDEAAKVINEAAKSHIKSRYKAIEIFNTLGDLSVIINAAHGM